MTYKQHWDFSREGLTSLCSASSSACHTMELDGLVLKAGGTYTANTGKTEFGITILNGTCDLVGDGFAFTDIGRRETVFGGKAYAAYLPCGVSFTVTAKTDLRIIFAKCPSETAFAPVLITPDDILVKKLGKPGFEREAHFIIDERIQASRIYIGENFIQGGQWSGFPGHKHDVDNVPVEGFAEEIYYFEYDKPTGYGIQQVYTSDRKIDETYCVRNGDLVEIPKGYHPGTVVPGYTGYLLWVMSCNTRGFYRTEDPEQSWMSK